MCLVAYMRLNQPHAGKKRHVWLATYTVGSKRTKSDSHAVLTTYSSISHELCVVSDSMNCVQIEESNEMVMEVLPAVDKKGKEAVLQYVRSPDKNAKRAILTFCLLIVEALRLKPFESSCTEIWQ